MNNLQKKTGIVIKDCNGNYLGKDYHSNGYPTVPSSLYGIVYFIDKKNAQGYIDVFKDSSMPENYNLPWTICEVKLVET